jgi:type IV secretion system protein VirB9
MTRKFLSLIAISFVLPFSAALAEKDPRPISTDNRIRHIEYSPNQVFHVKGSYGFVTTIEFAEDEDMKGVFIGDSIAWMVMPTPPRGNRLFLKPAEPNAVTNMTVTTNKRVYLFQLSDARTRDDTTYIVRFQYPRYQAFATQTQNPTQKPIINDDYSVAGSTEAQMGIRLRSVYDDGQFTYFSFMEGSDTPGIYLVQADGTEATVNQRRESGYLVVEKIANNFTLRRGELYLCIRNDKRIAEETQRIKEIESKGNVKKVKS